MSSQLERLQAATKPTRVTAVTATVTTPTGAGWRLLAFNSENAHKLALTGAGLALDFSFGSRRSPVRIRAPRLYPARSFGPTAGLDGIVT